MKFAILLSLAVMSLIADDASAQLAVGGQLTTTRIGELDATDVGFGGRASWQLSPLVGVEGEINFFPRSIPDRVAVSGDRVEGLFGVTAGPRIDTWRPFARVRPGFVRIGAAPQPIACILIFPPPLSCTLAAGQTLFALDLGGGVELETSSRTFLRLDLGDRMIRYGGPAMDRNRQVHDNHFLGHDLRLGIGGGWRF